MHYPVEDTAAKHEQIFEAASPRFAAVTWTYSRAMARLPD
jgi:hypothetical protein